MRSFLVVVTTLKLAEDVKDAVEEAISLRGCGLSSRISIVVGHVRVRSLRLLKRKTQRQQGLLRLRSAASWCIRVAVEEGNRPVMAMEKGKAQTSWRRKEFRAKS